MRIATRTCRRLMDGAMRIALVPVLALVIGAPAGAGTATYYYDELGRLKQVSHEDGQQTTYTLDAAGNRTNLTTTPPPGFLQFTSASYSVSENVASVTITVSRINGTYGAVSANYATTGTGTGSEATAGVDYTAVSGTLNWANGDFANKTFAIPVLDDAAFEGNETLAVTLAAGPGALLGLPASATITINDYEPGILQLSPAAYSIAENGGTATVAVTRTAGSSGAVSVNYATSSGTAVSGTDFTATSGTLNWAAGDPDLKTFAVAIIDDSSLESLEALNLTLSTPTGGANLGTSSGTISITDYEPGQLQFSPTAYTVTEAATTVTVTLTRSNGSDGAVGVGFAASADTATSPSDFTATSGTRTWANGDSALKTFTVTIANDSTGEVQEYVNLALSNPTGGATLGTDSTGTITINDDETGRLQFSSSSYSVAEAGGPATITVTRVNGSTGAATVNYTTSNGSAMAGSDYTAVSGMLSWTNGDSNPKAFAIPITNDSIYDPDEAINVSLSGPTGAVLSTPNSGAVAITDDDPAVPGTLALSPATYSVLEAATTVTVTVARTGGSDLPVSVQYGTFPDTATAGTDYQIASGTLNWTHGDSAAKSFVVTIVDNSTGEPTESLNLTLSNIGGGATLGTSSGTLTINDNEPGYLRLLPNSYTVGEAAGSVTITAVRENGTYGAVSATYGTTNGTAVAGSDFTAPSGTVNWANGDAASKTFNVSITDDAVVDPSESFTLTLTNPTGGASVVFPPAGSVTITDNDSTVPSTPANLQPYGIRTSSPYTMTWSASSGPLSYYVLSADPGGSETLHTINEPTTSKSVESGDGQQVFYKIRACNSSDQCSPWSATVWVQYCDGGNCQ